MVATLMTLGEKLAEFYLSYDVVDGQKMCREDAVKYFETVYSKGRILYETDNDGNLLGYIDSWRLTFEQFGKFICERKLDVDKEDINHGSVIYLSSITIHPDYRNTEIITLLRNKFFMQNFTGEYFIGHAIRKRHQPIMVHKRKDTYFKFMKGGDE